MHLKTFLASIITAALIALIVAHHDEQTNDPSLFISPNDLGCTKHDYTLEVPKGCAYVLEYSMHKDGKQVDRGKLITNKIKEPISVFISSELLNEYFLSTPICKVKIADSFKNSDKFKFSISKNAIECTGTYSFPNESSNITINIRSRTQPILELQKLHPELKEAIEFEICDHEPSPPVHNQSLERTAIAAVRATSS